MTKEQLKAIFEVYKMCAGSLSPAQFEQWIEVLDALRAAHGWEEVFVLCPECLGDGFTSEHALHPHPDGDCCGECPVAVQCAECTGTGMRKI